MTTPAENKTAHPGGAGLQDNTLDPEIAVAQAIPVPSGDHSSPAAAYTAAAYPPPAAYSNPPVVLSGSPVTPQPTNNDGHYVTTKPYTVPPEAVAPPQPQYTVSPQLHGRQVARSRRRNCLICGSVAVTSGIAVCICCLLPLVIFLVVWFRMEKSMDASWNGYDDDGWN